MVDIKLVDYIKRHQQKGYKKEELLRILVQNGWLKDEVNEAFKFIENKQQPEKQKEKPTQVNEEKGPSRQEQLIVLKNFIISSRSKGISDFEIKNALRSKGWPEDLLDQGFKMFIQTQPQKPIIQSRPIQERIEVKPKKERKPINIRKIIWFFIAFVVATLIITGTIFVYNYVIGLSDYTLVQNGEELHGKCLEKDCSDMKDFAFNYAKENLNSYLLIGIIASLTTVILYATLPFRNVVLWVVNGLYFVFLIYIGYIWLAFSSSV